MIELSGKYHFSYFETPFGLGTVIVKDDVLVSVRLPESGNGVKQIADPELSRLSFSCLSETAAEMLRKYFIGEKVAFDLPLSYAGKTDFQRAVLEVVRTIPYGSLMTYGEVARIAGSPQGSRGVGGVMASNLLPIVIPCHRVVGKSGELTGYTAPGGMDLKRWLLVLEGLKFDLRGRVVL